MRSRIGKRFAGLVAVPVLRRIAFHAKRITGNASRGFFLRMLLGLVLCVLLAAVVVTLIEGRKDTVGHYFQDLGASFYWAVTTVMGSGDSSYVTSWPGYIVSWLLVLFGVAIVASITGALVGFVIDFLLKEGQGMGASGYRDHIVVCGWNSTARDLIAELSGDEYQTKIVLLQLGREEPGRQRRLLRRRAT